MAKLKPIDVDIEKYKYKGIHYHLHGLYVFTEEQLLTLLEAQNARKTHDNALKHTQEEMQEALMRLTMCARKECFMCKYKKDRPMKELPSNDCKEMTTENMNILADACIRNQML